MIFCKYYKQKKRQFERKLKIFRIDNDTKYFDIIKVCIENDIHYQKIDVYAYEQIVNKKRIIKINLTLLNKIRVILFLIKLNKKI